MRSGKPDVIMLISNAVGASCRWHAHV